jgi:8-oxo-dGTP diphosphatase
MVIEHDYGDKCVRLDVHIVDDFTGTAHGAEGQQGKWVALSELDDYSFPAANVEIIEKIKQRFEL